MSKGKKNHKQRHISQQQNEVAKGWGGGVESAHITTSWCEQDISAALGGLLLLLDGEKVSTHQGGPRRATRPLTVSTDSSVAGRTAFPSFPSFVCAVITGPMMNTRGRASQSAIVDERLIKGVKCS